MKKIIAKYGQILAAFAFVVATNATTYNCVFVFHQAVIPDSVKKLRRF